MKTSLPLLLGIGLVIASASAEAHSAKPPPPPQIEYESRFITISVGDAKRLGLIQSPEEPDSKWRNILSPTDVEKLMQATAATKSVELLAAPRVTSKSGQRAVIEIIREFRYPTEFEDTKRLPTPTTFETRNVGVSLEVNGTVTAGNLIDITAIPSLIDFEQFVRYHDGKIQARSKPDPTDKSPWFLQPVFDAMRIPVNVTLRPDQTLLLGGFPRMGTGLPYQFDIETTPDEARRKAGASTETKLLFVLLTPHTNGGIIAVGGDTAAMVKPGDPIEIESQLISVERHRLPAGIQMLIEHPSTTLSNSKSTWPKSDFQPRPKSPSVETGGDPHEPSPMRLTAVYSRLQAGQLRTILQQASVDDFPNGPREVTSSKGQYSVEAVNTVRYPAVAKDNAAKSKADTTNAPLLEQMILQLKVEPEAALDGSINLDLTADIKITPKSAGNGAAGSQPEAYVRQWNSHLSEAPISANFRGKPHTSSLTVYSGATVMLVSASPSEPDHLQILLITVKGAGDGRDKLAEAADDGDGNSDPQKLPRAIPAKDKPGFVVSPYAPDAGFVDARGFPSGTQVKDPYSNRYFVLP